MLLNRPLSAVKLDEGIKWFFIFKLRQTAKKWGWGENTPLHDREGRTGGTKEWVDIQHYDKLHLKLMTFDLSSMTKTSKQGHVLCPSPQVSSDTFSPCSRESTEPPPPPVHWDRSSLSVPVTLFSALLCDSTDCSPFTPSLELIPDRLRGSTVQVFTPINPLFLQPNLFYFFFFFLKCLISQATVPTPIKSVGEWIPVQQGEGKYVWHFVRHQLQWLPPGLYGALTLSHSHIIAHPPPPYLPSESWCFISLWKDFLIHTAPSAATTTATFHESDHSMDF